MNRLILDVGPRLRRLLLVALVFAVPVLFLPGVTLDPFNVPKLALLMLGTAFVAVLRLAEVLAGSRSWQGRSILVPALALAVALFVSWIASPYRDWAVFGQYSRFQGLIPQVTVIVFGVLVADAFRGRLTQLMWAVATAGGAVGLYAFVQMLGLDPFDWAYEDASWAISTLGHTNFTGGFLAMVLPYSLFLWLKGTKWRLLAIALTVLIVEGLVLANSQGGWLAGIAGVAVALALGARRGIARRAGVVVAALAAVLAVGAVLASIAKPASPLATPTGISRGYIWEAALGMSADSPIVGWGPNVFALVGVQYRPLEDAVTLSSAIADDPHSVPLALLSGTGLVGLVAYLVVAGWVLRVASRLRDRSFAAPFVGAAGAWLVQSLVSIDVVSLRVVLWTTLAGLAIADQTSQQGEDMSGEIPPPPHGWRSALPVAALLLLAPIALPIANFFVSDVRVRHGAELFDAGRIADGREQFEHALDSRDESRYRRLYGERLGVASLERGTTGQELAAEMERAFGYLEELPDIDGLGRYADLLKARGTFDEAYFYKAVRVYERARRLDPFNPLHAVGIAESWLGVDRPDKAVAALRPLVPLAQHRYPLPAPSVTELWAALSIAELEAGNRQAAERALGLAASGGSDSCRVAIAEELLRVSSEARPSPPDRGDVMRLSFICDRTLYTMLLDLLPPAAREHYR